MLHGGGPPASCAPLLLYPRLPAEPAKGGDSDPPGVGLVQRAGVAAESCRGRGRAGGSRAQNESGRRWVDLSTRSRGSGGSSRRRRARRRPGGCRRTAAVPGPPPHDRSAASGSRAPLMPCRGSWRVKELGSGRGRGVLSSDGCRNKLGRTVGSDHCSSHARSPPSGCACGSCLPEVARSGRRSARPQPFILRSPRLSPGFLLPLGSGARPALSSPLAEPSVLAFAHKPFASFQAHLAPSVPGMSPPGSPLVTDVK